MDNIINNFILTHKPSICVLTPCFQGNCNQVFVKSCIETKNIFKEFDIPIIFEFCNYDKYINLARNTLIAKAMAMENITHFMFIDSNIEWKPIDIIKLIISDKCIIGGVCPISKLKLNTISENSDLIDKWNNKMNDSNINIPNETILQNNILDYDVILQNNSLKIENGISKVHYTSCSFMLIKRFVIEQLQNAFPKLKYFDNTNTLSFNQQKNVFALFDSGIIDDKYCSEDIVFCERWKNINGSIWICLSININNVNQHTFKGSFYNSILQI